MVLLSFAVASKANELKEATAIQKQKESSESKSDNIEKRKIDIKNKMTNKIEDAFHQYFLDVKKSDLSLENVSVEINKINNGRKNSNTCCEINIAEYSDDGLYAKNFEGEGLFAIKGFGLQSISYRIIDESFNENGYLSNSCNIEISLSYKNSMIYKCDDVLNGKNKKELVSDFKKMLPKALKDYN